MSKCTTKGCKKEHGSKCARHCAFHHRLECLNETVFKFGDKGIWKKPASERTKAKRVPAVVLEQTIEGVLYIFTYEKRCNNLMSRTATIFTSDFILTETISRSI